MEAYDSEYSTFMKTASWLSGKFGVSLPSPQYFTLYLSVPSLRGDFGRVLRGLELLHGDLLLVRPVLVAPEGGLGDAGPGAVLALVGLLAGVDAHVRLQPVDVHEALAALRAVVLGRPVRLHVLVQATCKWGDVLVKIVFPRPACIGSRTAGVCSQETVLKNCYETHFVIL